MTPSLQNFTTWPRRDKTLGGLLGLFMVAGLLLSLYLHGSARRFVAESNLPILPATHSDTASLPTADLPPEIAPPAPESLPPGDEAAAAPPAAIVTPPASGAEAPLPAAADRMTILVMGIDRREGEEGPWRTDSMILLSLDPKSESVAMLSFPRDLFVTMPDYGYGEGLDRINKAFFLGDAQDYPGGGAALAKQAIRRNFGLEVDRYLVMDFNGFRRIVDEIGGIEVDVPATLVDDQYPTEDYGTMAIRFEEGRQHMDGERALIYSRTRKSTSDFARAERQQQVILAVRDRVLSLGIIPSLTPPRVASLVRALDDSIQTDLTLDEVLALARAAQGIDSKNIQRAVIDATLTTDYTTYEGAQVLLPKWDEILPLVRETFGVRLLPIAPTPTPPPPRPTATPTPTEAERPRQAAGTGQILVYNGTPQRDLEDRVAAELRANGWSATGSGGADRTDYPGSIILLYNEEMTQSAYALQSYLGGATIRTMSREGAGPDLVLILGSDMLTASGGTP